MRTSAPSFVLLVLLCALAACDAKRGDVLSTGRAGSGPDAGSPEGGAAGAAAGMGGAGVSGQAGVGAGGALGMTFYISPAGDDANPGTEAAPWKTFAHALPLLAPGATLVLMDGVYASATTGYLQAFCGTNAVDGTAGRPITVRAQNERRALLKGEGAGAPIELSGCSNWILEGLYGEGADVPNEMGDEPGSVVVITHGCTNVVLRRMLAAHPNRYLTASAFVVGHDAVNILVEECEALDFHYYGFHAFDVQNMVFRRNYAHSRDVPDIVGGTPTANVTMGDGGFLLTKSSNAIVENCIAEHVADGFSIVGSRVVMGGKVQPQRDRILGSIANDVSRAGFFLESRCNNTKPCNQGDQIVSDPLLSNNVVRHASMGVLSEGGVRIQVENASIFDVTETGIVFGQDAENMGLASSAFARATVVTTGSAPYGFRAVGQVDWSFSRCNAFGPTMPFAPRDAHVVNSTEVDPQMGACYVVVPDASPLKNAGMGGAGIGANIVYRTEDGEPTTTKLWDQTTGAFTCGATVAGVNDATRTDVSCVGVAARLHVGAMGCAIP
jgi:hypothetical protein